MIARFKNINKLIYISRFKDKSTYSIIRITYGPHKF